MAFNADEFIKGLKNTGASPVIQAPSVAPSAPPQGVPSAVPVYQPPVQSAPPPPRPNYQRTEREPASAIVMQKVSKRTGKEYFSGFITEEGFAFLQKNWGQKMGFNLNFTNSGGGNKPVAYINFFLFGQR